MHDKIYIFSLYMSPQVSIISQTIQSINQLSDFFLKLG